MVGDLVHIEECIGTTGEERVEVPADLLLIYSDTRSVFLDMSSLTGEKDSVQRKVWPARTSSSHRDRCLRVARLGAAWTRD